MDDIGRALMQKGLVAYLQLKCLGYHQNKTLAGRVDAIFEVDSLRIVPYEGVGEVLICRSCQTILDCNLAVDGRLTVSALVSCACHGENAVPLRQGKQRLQAFY